MVSQVMENIIMNMISAFGLIESWYQKNAELKISEAKTSVIQNIYMTLLSVIIAITVLIVFSTIKDTAISDNHKFYKHLRFVELTLNNKFQYKLLIPLKGKH